MAAILCIDLGLNREMSNSNVRNSFGISQRWNSLEYNYGVVSDQ
jgi:hypothetical protein